MSCFCIKARQKEKQDKLLQELAKHPHILLGLSFQKLEFEKEAFNLLVGGN